MKIVQIKKATIIVLVLALSLLLVYGGISINKMLDFEVVNSTSVNSSMVEKKLEAISELTVSKYNFKNILSYEDVKKFKGIELPLTKKSFLIVYSGYLKAGIDFSSLNVQISDNNAVTVIVDGVIITDAVINEDSFEIYDEQSAVFNELTFENLTELLVEAKENIQKEAIEEGFLDDANEKAKLLIQKFLLSMDFKDVTVIVNQDYND